MEKLKMLSRIQYNILPGKPLPSSSCVDLYNKAYLKWKKLWFSVYEEADALNEFSVDDFSRQDIIPVLTYEDEIVGMHLYSFWDLEQYAAKEHHYFKFYPKGFVEFLQQKNARWVMSMEYLTVDQNWRKRKIGLSMGEIVVGVGLELLKSIGADCVVAPARTDNKVDRMCENYNFDFFQTNVNARNFNVDLVAGFPNRLRPNPDSKMKILVDELWTNRKDFTGEFPRNKVLSVA